MGGETPQTSLTTTGGDPNGSKTITDKDLQAVSEQLLNLLSAAPRTLCCLGQCFAIAWADGADTIVQENDPELYARIGLPATLSWSFANSTLPDPSFSERTSSNVLISGEMRSGKRGTEWVEYLTQFRISLSRVV